MEIYRFRQLFHRHLCLGHTNLSQYPPQQYYPENLRLCRNPLNLRTHRHLDHSCADQLSRVGNCHLYPESYHYRHLSLLHLYNRLNRDH